MKLILTIIQIVLSMIGALAFIGISYIVYIAYMYSGLNSNTSLLLSAFINFTILFYFILESSVDKPNI